MSRLRTTFVLGYHGCDRAFGMDAINRQNQFKPSDQPHDWLGNGVYFWEADPDRAREWALERQKRSNTPYEPFAVGAVIDLGNCLDLTLRENIEHVKAAYSAFAAMQKKAGLKMPVNRSPKGDQNPDNVLRFLDCAVINHLHGMMEQGKFPPYDTVRAAFGEGVPIYSTAGFREKTHVQIAVRNLDCIKGIFLPPKQ